MNIQLGTDDYVAVPGTISRVPVLEYAIKIAQICHGLRVGLPIPERVYFAQGLESVANAWLLARCDNGATVKETPVEGSELSLYEPYWTPLEMNQEQTAMKKPKSGLKGKRTEPYSNPRVRTLYHRNLDHSVSCWNMQDPDPDIRFTKMAL